ncbi:akirin [Drosophila gunungcola]|uniref:akirin n=1 Tax=Drosophila gunungcola TaxID=103775 RepID=UPI0022E54DCF|nr:akirin [Drosophila gunungcola]
MNCLSLKRFLILEDNSTDHSPAKRRRLRCQELNITKLPSKICKDKDPKIPRDFLKGLPVLLDTDSSDSEIDSRTFKANATKIAAPDNQKLFSFEQLQSIFCGMLQQCENRVKEEFELELTQKMAEQYDIFIKFTHDQMQREGGQNASYLS